MPWKPSLSATGWLLPRMPSQSLRRFDPSINRGLATSTSCPHSVITSSRFGSFHYWTVCFTTGEVLVR